MPVDATETPRLLLEPLTDRRQQRRRVNVSMRQQQVGGSEGWEQGSVAGTGGLQRSRGDDGGGGNEGENDRRVTEAALMWK